MDQDRFLELLIKKKLNSATLDDMVELKEYLESSDYNFISDSDISMFPEFTIDTYTLNDEEIESKWENFNQKIALVDEVYIRKINDKKQSLLKRIISINSWRLKSVALIAGAILILGILFWNKGNKETAKQNIVNTKYGSKSKIQLPDGTLVWLNSGSRLTYDDEYGKTNRIVKLVGEAFFDVKHDPDKPFLIHTKELNLKVLGTAFNIKAYPRDKISEASLIRGSLEVSFPSRPTEKIVLKPNEKIALVNPNMIEQSTLKQNLNKKNINQENEVEPMPIISLSQVSYIPSENEVQEISWVKNKLIFRNKAFGELAKEMERWYDVEIYFKDKTILNKKFTGTFKNETFIEALDVLKQTYYFNYAYDRNKNKVTITN